MPVRFVLIAPARSGSTMTKAVLAAHPQIHMHGEAMGRNAARSLQRTFLPVTVRYLGRDKFQAEMLLARARDTRNFIASYLFAAGNEKRAAGFKLLLEQAFSLGFSDALSWLSGQPDLRIVWLERRNHLARYVSSLLHSKNRKAAARNAQAVPETTTDVDPEQFQQAVKNLRATTAILRGFFVGHPSLDVAYEDLVRDPRAGYRGIFSFLDVDAGLEPSIETTKGTTADLQSIIANIGAIRDHAAIRPYLR